MADVFTTFGFLFSATDLASAVLTKSAQLVASTVAATEKGFDKFATTTDNVMLAMGKSVGFVGDSFVHVFGDLYRSTVTPFGKGMAGVASSVSAKVMGLAAAVKDFGVKTAFVLTKQQFSFSQLFAAIGKGVPIAATAIKTKLGGALEALKVGASKAALGIGGVLQNLLSIEKVKGVGAAIGSAFLGPLGLVMKLLSPILDIVTRALEPAIETFGAVLDNAFAPFSFLMEQVAPVLGRLAAQALAPIASFLTLIAAQAAAFVGDIALGGKAVGPLSAAFQALMPAVQGVFKALTGLVGAVIPVLVRLAQTLVPIVTKIIGVALKFVETIVPVITHVVEQVGPVLVDTFGKLLEAVIPLLAPLTQLAGVLLEKVFAPLLIVTIKGVASALTFIADILAKDVIPVAVPFIEEITASVADFFGNLSKYGRDFYVLIIKPISDAVGELIETLGLDKAAAAVGGVFDAVLKAVMSPLETLKSLINSYLIAPLNSILQWKIPLVGDQLGKVIGVGSVPMLREGGIATSATTAVVGEAGEEAIIPRTPEAIEQFVSPVLKGLEIPGLDRVVAALEDVQKLLRGTLRVQMAGGDGAGASATAPGAEAGRSREDQDLSAAVGVEARSW